jgi:hypothetical protein
MSPIFLDFQKQISGTGTDDCRNFPLELEAKNKSL